MTDHRRRVPAYRHFKPKNLAVVRIHGKDYYLGRYGTEASKELYHRLLAERYFATPLPKPAAPDEASSLVVQDLALHFFTHCESYYQRDGRPTSEVDCIRHALRRLIKLYGELPVREFSPSKLKKVRDEFIRDGLCRSVVNNHISRIKRMFRWAVENELVPVTVYQALATVSGLRKGRSDVRERKPVRAVDDAVIEKTLPFLASPVRAMVQLQLLTGCRPGEICSLRPIDIDRSGDVWCFQPTRHKTAHHDVERRIFLGPKAQSILAPWLRRSPEAFCFSPEEAAQEKRDERTTRRKTPVGYGNGVGKGRKKQPKRKPGAQYTPASYRRAIERACLLAFPRPKECEISKDMKLAPEEARRRREVRAQWRRSHCWHPNQLRHTRATELRRLYGLDAAQVVLGHTEAFVTQIYAERDFAKAADIMRLSG